MSADERKARFFSLAERYCQFGPLLPTEEGIDTDDAAAMAEAKVVLAEVARTKAEMDALLERAAAVLVIGG
jgi:hypothetical protein